MNVSVVSKIMRILHFFHIPSHNIDKLKYFAHRYIFRTIPFSDEKYQKKWQAAQLVLDTYNEYVNDGNAKVCYEIGCGRELAMALYLSNHFDKIYCLDIAENVKPDLLNHTLSVMTDNNSTAGMTSIKKPFNKSNYKDVLIDMFGIHYLAPADSSKTGLAEASVSVIFSQSVFEHICETDIPKVLAECKRIMTPEGIMIARIDYSDHLAYIDKSLSAYNFLRFSASECKKYDPELHVNRLRHSDFVRLFTENGWTICKEEKIYPPDYKQTIRTFPFHEEILTRYAIEDLEITGGLFVVKKQTA